MFGQISFNRGAFNRAAESTTTSWMGSAQAVAEAEAGLRLTKRMSGEGNAVATATATASNIHYQIGTADAVATAISEWIRRRGLDGHADAIATGSAVGVYQMGADYLAFDISLNAGDDLIIDTERMTILRNNQNFIYALDDYSTFFDLAKGDYITIAGDGTATVTLLWKDRWL